MMTEGMTNLYGQTKKMVFLTRALLHGQKYRNLRVIK